MEQDGAGSVIMDIFEKEKDIIRIPSSHNVTENISSMIRVFFLCRIIYYHLLTRNVTATYIYVSNNSPRHKQGLILFRAVLSTLRCCLCNFFGQEIAEKS